jgi:hypothetical protein
MKYGNEVHIFNPEDGFSRKLRYFLKRVPISDEELRRRYTLPPGSRRVPFYRMTRLIALFFMYTRAYGAYWWYRLLHPQDSDEYSIDLWLKAPVMRRKI